MSYRLKYKLITTGFFCLLSGYSVAKDITLPNTGAQQDDSTLVANGTLDKQYQLKLVGKVRDRELTWEKFRDYAVNFDSIEIRPGSAAGDLVASDGNTNDNNKYGVFFPRPDKPDETLKPIPKSKYLVNYYKYYLLTDDIGRGFNGNGIIRYQFQLNEKDFDNAKRLNSTLSFISKNNGSMKLLLNPDKGVNGYNKELYFGQNIYYTPPERQPAAQQVTIRCINDEINCLKVGRNELFIALHTPESRNTAIDFANLSVQQEETVQDKVALYVNNRCSTPYIFTSGYYRGTSFIADTVFSALTFGGQYKYTGANTIRKARYFPKKKGPRGNLGYISTVYLAGIGGVGYEVPYFYTEQNKVAKKVVTWKKYYATQSAWWTDGAGELNANEQKVDKIRTIIITADNTSSATKEHGRAGSFGIACAPVRVDAYEKYLPNLGNGSGEDALTYSALGSNAS